MRAKRNAYKVLRKILREEKPLVRLKRRYGDNINIDALTYQRIAVMVLRYQ